MIYVNPVFLFILPSFFIAIASIAYLCGIKATRGTAVTGWKLTLICAVVPGLLFLLIFFTFAVHMHNSLGQWPETLGNHGFSPALNTHARIAATYFSGFVIFAILAWPVLIAFFAIIAKLRRFLPQVMALGLSFWIFVPWIFLAPSGFLNWWWD